MLTRIIGSMLILALVATAVAPEEPPAFVEITPDQVRAVDRALEFLARKQNRDGSWDSGFQYTRHPGITALACLAFMAAGNLPEEGLYADTVKRGLAFIVKSIDAEGLISGEGSYNPMYGHGYATLFLAEVYGMAGDRDIKPALGRAVELIVRGQKSDGGWRYTPDNRGNSDISVTVVQLMALRAARNGGIAVDAAVIDRALAYIRRSVCPDGGFSYTLDQKQSGFARTAAGVTSLFVGGAYDAPEIAGGLQYLESFRDREEFVQYYFYGHYYAAQAMHQAGGVRWQGWFDWIRAALLTGQAEDGSWTEQGHGGPVFATAMAAMILEIPYRYLPIFQR